MKTYFDIEKAEAEMSAAAQRTLDNALRGARNQDDIAFIKTQARFTPAQIAICREVISLKNERVDEVTAAEALAAAIALLIANCDKLTEGQNFFAKLIQAMESLRRGQSFSNTEVNIKPEPLS